MKTSIIFLVVVDRSDIDDCQILQSFVLGGREAMIICCFFVGLSDLGDFKTTFKRVAESDVTSMVVRFYRVLF